MIIRRTNPRFNVSADPVRPGLDMAFRLAKGREVLTYVFKKRVVAVCCVAYTSDVPTTMDDLDGLASLKGPIAVPYTVWSYKKGFGRSMVFRMLMYLRDEKPTIRRVVTLSPKTEMAYKFHTGNGAIQISKNAESDNYEYFSRNTSYPNAV